MIQSMTGFGRAAFEVEGVRFDVEARSVNHRYLDLRVRLPRQLSHFESVAKASVQGRLRRGRIDASVVFSESDAERMELHVDHELAGKYVSASRTESWHCRVLPLSQIWIFRRSSWVNGWSAV